MMKTVARPARPSASRSPPALIQRKRLQPRPDSLDRQIREWRGLNRRVSPVMLDNHVSILGVGGGYFDIDRDDST